MTVGSVLYERARHGDRGHRRRGGARACRVGGDVKDGWVGIVALAEAIRSYGSGVGFVLHTRGAGAIEIGFSWTVCSWKAGV